MIRKVLCIFLAVIILSVSQLAAAPPANAETVITQTKSEDIAAQTPLSVFLSYINQIKTIFISLFTYFEDLRSTEGKDILNNKFTLSYIARDAYFDLLENPAQDILSDKTNVNCSDIFSNSKQPWNIKREFTQENILKSYEYLNGYYTVGTLQITRFLVNFAGNKNALTGFLKENGVSGKAQGAELFFYPAMPLIIRVSVENSDYYYITVTEKSEFYGAGDSPYTYLLYDCDAFSEKFSPKEGKLIINGEELTDGSKVIFHSRGIDLPFFTLLDALDIEVEWLLTEPALFKINYNGMEHTFGYGNYREIMFHAQIISTDEYRLYNTYSQAAVSGDGDEFYLCGRLANNALSLLFRSSYTIDYDSLSVTISL